MYNETVKNVLFSCAFVLDDIINIWGKTDRITTDYEASLNGAIFLPESDSIFVS